MQFFVDASLDIFSLEANYNWKKHVCVEHRCSTLPHGPDSNKTATDKNCGMDG